MEIHDGRPVTKNQAWFRRHLFEVPDQDARWLYEDAVQLWLVLGVSRESSYRKRPDEPETKTRTTVIDVDTVVALSGDIREQAIAFIAEERRGELRDETGDLELDRLADYLASRWPGVEFTGSAYAPESPVDMAIRLLEGAPSIAEDVMARPSSPALKVEHLEPDDEPEPEQLSPPAEGPRVVKFRPDTEEISVPHGERIGSIYHGPSRTRDLLEQEFR